MVMSCSVLAEIHALFPGELSEHTEQTHTNITWLAASQNQTAVVLFLLEQASRAGWSIPPGLVAVSCSPFLRPHAFLHGLSLCTRPHACQQHTSTLVAWSLETGLRALQEEVVNRCDLGAAAMSA